MVLPIAYQFSLLALDPQKALSRSLSGGGMGMGLRRERWEVWISEWRGLKVAKKGCARIQIIQIEHSLRIKF